MSMHQHRAHVPLGRRMAAAACAGAALVLPLALLEWWSGGGFPAGVPLALFVTLWVLAAAACLLAWWATTGDESAAGMRRSLPRRGAALAGALLVAGFWLTLVHDQWRCLRGLPNCD